MQIKTKYEIGDRIWIVYEGTYRDPSTGEFVLNGEVSIYDTEISSVAIDEIGLVYCCKDGEYDEIKEEDIIPYEDKNKLLGKIESLMQKIHKREDGNLQSS